MITKLCEHCGLQITRPLYPSMMDEARFCDNRCRHAFDSAEAQARRYRVEMTQMKQCTKCGATRAVSEFYKNKNTSDGRSVWCKPCCRADKTAYRQAHRDERKRTDYKYHLKFKHGLTVEQFDALLASQGDGCAICGDTAEMQPRTGRLYVDHCHTHRIVRGILCHRCNVAIGLLEDNPTLLRIAATYVEEFAAKQSMQGAILKLTEEDR